jgi:hypothetical protein
MSVKRPSFRRAVLVLALAALIAVPLALAHRKLFPTNAPKPTRTPVSQFSALYKGQVHSSKPICEKNRRVDIAPVGFPDDVNSYDYTDGRGRYRITGFAPPEGYRVYLKVFTKYLRDNDDHRHLCRGVLKNLTYPANPGP